MRGRCGAGRGVLPAPHGTIGGHEEEAPAIGGRSGGSTSIGGADMQILSIRAAGGDVR